MKSSGYLCLHWLATPMLCLQKSWKGLSIPSFIWAKATWSTPVERVCGHNQTNSSSLVEMVWGTLTLCTSAVNQWQRCCSMSIHHLSFTWIPLTYLEQLLCFRIQKSCHHSSIINALMTTLPVCSLFRMPNPRWNQMQAAPRWHTREIGPRDRSEPKVPLHWTFGLKTSWIRTSLSPLVSHHHPVTKSSPSLWVHLGSAIRVYFEFWYSSLLALRAYSEQAELRKVIQNGIPSQRKQWSRN